MSRLFLSQTHPQCNVSLTKSLISEPLLEIQSWSHHHGRETWYEDSKVANNIYFTPPTSNILWIKEGKEACPVHLVFESLSTEGFLYPIHCVCILLSNALQGICFQRFGLNSWVRNVPQTFFLRQNHRLGGTFYKLEKTKSGWLIKVICVYF